MSDFFCMDRNSKYLSYVIMDTIGGGGGGGGGGAVVGRKEFTLLE